MLTAGLHQAGEEKNFELLMKYENITEKLLISLQGKSIDVDLRIELNKLKAQHTATQKDVTAMIESVKQELEKLKIKKERMSAYAEPPKTHLNIKA